jgi:hypothetical protein
MFAVWLAVISVEFMQLAPHSDRQKLHGSGLMNDPIKYVRMMAIREP